MRAGLPRGSSATAEEVINRLQVTAPNQVNLRVRIAEVSRNAAAPVRHQLGSAGRRRRLHLRPGDRQPDLRPDPRSGTGGGVVQPLLTRQNGVNNIIGSYHSDDVDVNTLIDLLAEDNLIAILAEPNLTALSGETASFLAGGEFPVPVPDDDGIAIEYKKFGVGLAFTPTVLSAEPHQHARQPGGQPALERRRGADPGDPVPR